MQQALDVGSLLGPPPSVQRSAERRALLDRLTQDGDFATARAALGERLVEHGWDKKGRLNQTMLANELVDILEPVNDALVRAGLDPAGVAEALGRDGLTAFLRDLPTRALSFDLLRDKDAQEQQKREPNDLNDVMYLPVAAVHCDIVVTERSWGEPARPRRHPRRYGTRVLHDLAGLTAVLVIATRYG